ncbi:DUF968 domain-containing protein [Buttiauxella massiliensis]|uniref:DUF968 domain-containing protein n=1 Tax=Buttiauxella massiliensis TaxID=2831590 RepID=UPI00125FA933|nr:DUF968 domain-containing protein [Buttiauxella massiliensis]
MRVILTPEIAPRLGLALFRPGSDVMALFHQGRVLIECVPEHLKHLPSGIVPAATQPLCDDKALLAFFTNARVIQAAGGLSTLKASLLRENGCQYPHGDYHHPEMVIMPYPPGSIRICWHCDNKLREQATELLADLAHRNVVEFVIASALRNLGFDDTHQLTLPELCWWAIRYDLVDCLPEGMARRALRMPQDVIPSVSRECDIVPDVPATSIIQEKVKPVFKLKVDPESPGTLMKRPKRIRLEKPTYLQWVKTQPCEGCGSPADDPHHLIGWGQGGMGTKAHDVLSIPLCRTCHTELHNDPVKFEQKHGSQPVMIIRVIDRACSLGVLA